MEQPKITFYTNNRICMLISSVNKLRSSAFSEQTYIHLHAHQFNWILQIYCRFAFWSNLFLLCRCLIKSIRCTRSVSVNTPFICEPKHINKTKKRERAKAEWNEEQKTSSSHNLGKTDIKETVDMVYTKGAICRWKSLSCLIRFTFQNRLLFFCSTSFYNGYTHHTQFQYTRDRWRGNLNLHKKMIPWGPLSNLATKNWRSKVDCTYLILKMNDFGTTMVQLSYSGSYQNFITCCSWHGVRAETGRIGVGQLFSLSWRSLLPTWM